jgi:hypothetical protein
MWISKAKKWKKWPETGIAKDVAKRHHKFQALLC